MAQSLYEFIKSLQDQKIDNLNNQVRIINRQFERLLYFEQQTNSQESLLPSERQININLTSITINLPISHPNITNRMPSPSLSPSLNKIRSRISKIIDQQLFRFSRQIDISKNDTECMINQSRLEEWVEMFGREILAVDRSRDIQKNQVKIVVMTRGDPCCKQSIDDQIQHIQKIRLPLPYISQDSSQTNDVLVRLRSHDKIRLFTLDRDNIDKLSLKADKLSQGLFKQTQFQFPQGLIKEYCSITYIKASSTLILIGGSKVGNPNIKSSKIYSFNTKNRELALTQRLPYGLSSHFCVYNPTSTTVYIIGGLKSHSIVTRGCFKMVLSQSTAQVEQISCLNYPAASINCILWNQSYIYKFGGVGEVFGGWGTSPYIQRYSIQKDYWEVINPVINNISPTTQSTFANIFMARNSSYLCNHDRKSIFVFGGYSIEGQSVNNGMVLKIHGQTGQSQQSQQSTLNHTIQKFGTVQDLNFQANNQFIFHKTSQNVILMFGLEHHSKNSAYNSQDLQVYPALIRSFPAKQGQSQH